MDFRSVDKALVHPNLLRFARYCDELAGGAEMPSRKTFEVRNVPWLYGFVIVAEVIESGADYRYSYVGEFWKAILNYDTNNLRLSELEECGRFTNVRPNYTAAVQNRAARYRRAQITWRDGKHISYERLVMPFCNETGVVTELVVAAQCDRPLEEILAARGIGEGRLTLEENLP